MILKTLFQRLRLAALAVAICMPGAARSDLTWANLVCSYEAGKNPNAGFTNANAVLKLAVGPDDPEGIVSLGMWSQSILRGEPVGIIVGFSLPARNIAGDDLFIKGNAFAGWYEPGYVEVARETTAPAASMDGWQDETWYLLKPSNFSAVGDPRLNPLPIAFDQSEMDAGRNPFTDPNWSDPSALRGYADVSPSGDYFDIDWAIDAAGNPVILPEISYVRIRTVTDSPAGAFGYFSTDIDYVAAVEVVPEPGTLLSLVLGGLLLGRRRRSDKASVR